MQATIYLLLEVWRVLQIYYLNGPAADYLFAKDAANPCV
jgi:hypothetical protein